MTYGAVTSIVAALEEHRAATASLLDRLDALGSASKFLAPFSDLLREEDRALQPLVDRLAQRVD
jgi:hypothetical protein